MSTSEKISVKRIIEPFVYFPTHASAIKGLGGPYRSPDPNYCFHTHYFEYRPGHVVIHATLLGARATTGELSIRIHGYRPEHPELGIKLIAAERADLSGLADADHLILVRFSAIPGVHYAAYGYFSESSDLAAKGVNLIAEELGGDEIENYLESTAPHTLLETADLTGVNALVSSNPATLSFPTSQACTPRQLMSPLMHEALPALVEENAFTRWKAVFSLQALQAYGLLKPGATGLLIGDAPDPLVTHIQDRGCILQVAIDTGPEDVAPLLPQSLAHFDFVLCLDSTSHAGRYDGMQQMIDKIIQRLMSGGWAIILLDIVPEAPLESYRSEQRSDVATEATEIKRWALRLIGHGCDVAQLNFSSDGETFNEAGGAVPFGLIVRR